MTNYRDQIRDHYETQWRSASFERKLDRGFGDELSEDFSILEFSPRAGRDVWTYATCGMSRPDDEATIELHLFAPLKNDIHVESLTAVAHYHRTGSRLGLGHTIDFGRPWLPDSSCDRGYVSLPYLDGPQLESLETPGTGGLVRFLWLIPVTTAEVDYAKRHGIEAFERMLEEGDFNYADPCRASVV